MATLDVCPRCQSRWPIRLGPGEVCGTCKSNQVWAEMADQAQRIVITRQELAAAGGRDLQVRWMPTVLRTLPVVIAAGLLLGGGWLLGQLLAAQPLAPLATILTGQTTRLWQSALLVGLAGATAALALQRQRRGRAGRRLHLGASLLLGGSLGSLLVVLGCWATLPRLVGWRYTSPPLEPMADEQGARIQRSMVTLVAPDRDGNARSPALGMGMVVSAQAGRTWILTNSHVAIPHTAIAAVTERPVPPQVWVTFADGRSLVGQVRCTGRPPLDVALIEVALPGPPPLPVELSRPGHGVVLPGSSVLFLPNPLRNGWLVHRGAVLKTERHTPSSGGYDLVYTDLPIQPGDSGSGLFLDGQLVALNTWMLTGQDHPVGISLSAEDIRAMIDAVLAGKPLPGGLSVGGAS